MLIVFISGNLGRKPDLRYTPTGKAVADLSVAHKRFWTENGERKEETIWVTFTAWDKDAENAANFLETGQHVTIVGSIRRREPDAWLDKNTGQPRAKWAFTADRIEYGPKSSRGAVRVDETDLANADDPVEEGFF
jgi:single-strand DNA-binding protein